MSEDQVVYLRGRNPKKHHSRGALPSHLSCGWLELWETVRGCASVWSHSRGRWPGCSSQQLVESFPFRCKLPRTSSLPVLGRHMFSEPEKAPRQMLQVLTARNSWPGWRSERCAEEIWVGLTAPNIAPESWGLFQMQNFLLHNIL